MKKSEILMAKHDKHSAYFDAKKEQYLQMVKDSRSLKRLGRLMNLNGMLMELATLINNALLVELESTLISTPSTVLEEHAIAEVVKPMKKRTREQLTQSRTIYRKHAERHKVNDYPYHRCKRMIAYTALITKAIAKAGERR